MLIIRKKLQNKKSPKKISEEKRTATRHSSLGSFFFIRPKFPYAYILKNEKTMATHAGGKSLKPPVSPIGTSGKTI